MAIDLGTNLNWCTDWDPEKIPADLIWSARPWALGNGNGGNGDAADAANWCPIDTAGWPIVSVGTTFGIIAEADPWAGVYKLSFTNRSGTTGDTVSSYSGNITLTNRAHNAGTNITTYDLTVPSFVAGQFIWLLWAGSTGGVTNVHLMRPFKTGVGNHAIGTVLSDHIVDRLAWFTTIRPMQTQGGESGKSSGCDSVWANRTAPWGPQTRCRAGSLTRTVGVDPWAGTRASSGGMAVENMVAAANQAGKHLWICIPYNADDDYITKMAQAIRYGTNGYDPYTSTQGSPVFAPLAANLNVYVEWANEVWNPGAGYWNAENQRDDGAERAAGDPHHTGYRASGSGTYGMAYRRVGYQAVRHSLIFRSVFGDAAMMTRVRPVLATQHGSYATTDEPLYYVRDVWGQGYNSTVAYGQVNEYGNVARPASYYLYALATAPYIPSGDTAIDVTSASTMLTSTIADLNDARNGWPLTSMSWNRAIALSLGLKYLAYEGGDNLIPQQLSGGATAGNIANAKLASYNANGTDARMGANLIAGIPAADQSSYVYGRLFKEWGDRGGELFCHFTLGSSAGAGGMFGLCPPSATMGSDPRLETGPKWDAVKAFAAAIGLTIFADPPSGGFIRLHGSKPAGSTVGVYKR